MNSLDTLKSAIKERLAREREPFAVFDFDETCIKGDVGHTLFEYLVSIGRLQGVMLDTYRTLLAQGRTNEAYFLYGTILEGFTEAEAGKVVQSVLHAGGNMLVTRPHVLDLMQFLNEKGVVVWVMSGSHEVAVRAAMQKLGIEARLIGNKNVLKDGRYTAELQKPISMLEGKVECLRTYIHPTQAPLLVIDDSPTGIWLLQTADIKVVVDHNKDFVREARRRGWFIL